MKRKTILQEAAFMQILETSIKSYKREAFGLLTGRKENGIWIVENAFFSHTGSFSEANGNNKQKRKTARLTKRLEELNLNIIGDYHSHADYGGEEVIASPSNGHKNADLEDMLKNPDWIYFILSLNKQNRKQKWKTSKKGCLYGSMGDEYYCNLNAFCVNLKRRRKYDDVRISFPSIYKLD